MNISECVTKTLRSAETPIDIDLEADFEPATCMDTDCYAEGHEGILDNNLSPEHFKDAACSVASTESLPVRELLRSSHITHDDDDDESVDESGKHLVIFLHKHLLMVNAMR